MNLSPLKGGNGAGASGEYIKPRLICAFQKRHWIEHAVLVMDLSGASKHLGVHIALRGQDILRALKQLLDAGQIQRSAKAGCGSAIGTFLMKERSTLFLHNDGASP